jgi:hypothetical protein
MRLTLLTGLVLLAPEALANEIPCSPVEAGTIQLDGLLNDWQGAEGVGIDKEEQILTGKKEWSGPDDLSFDVYCNYDETYLYLAVDIKDEYFIRSRKAKGDDHLMVLFGSKKLVVYPGDLRGIPGRVTWGTHGRAKDIKMAEAMQPKGYSVELRFPLKSVPGYKAGVAALPGAVWVADSDSKAQGKVQTVMGTAPSGSKGSLTFAQAKADLSGFLKDRGYSTSDIRMKASADVVGDSRPEQVLLVGRTIGIIGEGLPGGSYFFLDLAKKAKDIFWLKIVDLNGDKKMEILARYAERGGNGRRELVAVFRFDASNKFVRSFAHEILKGQGSSVVTNRFSLKPRKGRGKKRGGVDLIFDMPKAQGFTEASYREIPAQDCFPILLPWDSTKKRHFRFEGEEYSQQ